MQFRAEKKGVSTNETRKSTGKGLFLFGTDFDGGDHFMSDFVCIGYELPSIIANFQ